MDLVEGLPRTRLGPLPHGQLWGHVLPCVWKEVPPLHQRHAVYPTIHDGGCAHLGIRKHHRSVVE